MSQTDSNGLWSDQVIDSDTSTKKPEAEYAIKWGEKVEVSTLLCQFAAEPLTDPSCHRSRTNSSLKSAQQTWLTTYAHSIM
jgi:hypothetical protein